MNTLFFSAAGFAFLFSLKGVKSAPRDVLQETFQIFSCVAVLVGAAGLIPVSKQDFLIWMIPAVFTVCSLARRPVIYFFCICGLVFPFLESRVPFKLPAGMLIASAVFASFRLLMLGFQERALFFRAPERFAGMPFLLVQAFWASLLIAAWLFFPYLAAPSAG